MGGLGESRYMSRLRVGGAMPCGDSTATFQEGMTKEHASADLMGLRACILRQRDAV
jgi:hypothetical protein